MADNIVERLRYWAWYHPSEGDTAEAHYLAVHALAEIERLRSLLARIVVLQDDYYTSFPEWEEAWAAVMQEARA